jgi:hypothetical protein
MISSASRAVRYAVRVAGLTSAGTPAISAGASLQRAPDRKLKALT